MNDGVNCRKCTNYRVLQKITKLAVTPCILYTKLSNDRTIPIKRTKLKTLFHMTCKEGQFDVVELI